MRTSGSIVFFIVFFCFLCVFVKFSFLKRWDVVEWEDCRGGGGISVGECSTGSAAR